jgi:two-component system, cell cycle sensor histidine kinase and response regulator CckA
MSGTHAPARVLLIDDDEEEFILTAELLRLFAPGEYALEWTPSYAHGLGLLRDSTHDAALVDYQLGGQNGLELIADLATLRSAVPMILLTGQGGRWIEAAALAAGAADYLEKGDVTGPLLDRSLRYAMGRRHAADALDSSEARYRAIVENSTEGLMLFDGARRIMLQSPAVGRLLGYTPAEMKGQSFDSLLKPDDLAAHLAAFAWAVAHPGAVRETELTARHKDGTWRVLGCSTVGRLHQPAVGAVVCNYRDVSRRRSAEDGALAAARQFSEIFGNSPTAMFIYDSVDGRITDANARFERLTEHTRQEILGRSSMDLGLWAPDSAALLLPGADLVRDLDARMVSRTGTQLEVCLSVERLDRRDQSNPLRVALITDVTEKHVLETQHRHSQKMEAIGQLAGGVAHDFNNLLTIIVGYAEILSARAELSPGALRDVGEIAKAGETAATLTKQLLTFSRRSVIERGAIDVNALVTTTYGLLARLIGDDIEMVVRLAPSLQAVVADRAQIEQCVMNLAVNARDAMPSGGRLVIETADVVLDAAFVRAHAGSREGKHVMIAVSDTGVGMDDAVRARAFEPFFTTKPHGKGTGLGLSTVYGALKQSHGFVVVESEPGHGSTFRIYLPATDGAVEAVPPANTGDDRRGSEAILLVEDEEGVRELVQRVLRERGYVVTVAASSTEAVQILSGDGGPFDLLLTDLVMPLIGGREVARICHDRDRNVRVLYMSGNAATLVQDGALQPGLALIQKPFAGPALLERVRAILDAPLAPSI